MPVPVDVKRAAFRQLYSSAISQAVTLQAALATAIAPSLAATLAGKEVIEAQADRVVTKYQLPANLSAGTPEVASMWGQLQDLYDLATSSVSGVPAGGGLAAEVSNLPHANGAAIYNWMLARLTVVRSFSTDHSNAGLR